MTIPWLAGLGAGLSELSGTTLDEKRRLRALQQAAAQFDAEQQIAQSTLGETRRHNTSMEALAAAEQADSRASTADLRKRQRVQTFSESAGRGGVNYLNPERAFESFNPPKADMFAVPGFGALSALEGVRGRVAEQTFVSGLEPTAQQLHRENRAVGFVPGSESIGGAIMENRNFSPFSNSSWRMGTTMADQEAMEFRSAMDDIQKAGDMAHQQGVREATEIQKLTDMNAIGRAAQTARENSMKQRALAWSQRLTNLYPNRAHLYTVEALLGQMTGSNPLSFPSQNNPQTGGNPLIPGGPSRPAAPAPPPQQSGNPLIQPSRRNPLIP
jgi:hypothetical protein